MSDVEQWVNERLLARRLKTEMVNFTVAAGTARCYTCDHRADIHTRPQGCLLCECGWKPRKHRR